MGAPAAYTTGYSVAPHIVALSPTTFAISYYNASYNPVTYATIYSYLSTTLGTVDPNTLAITLSAPIIMANNQMGSLSFVILSPVSMYQYVALWSDSSCATCGKKSYPTQYIYYYTFIITQLS